MDLRTRALKKAATHIGVTEHPLGSNHGVQVDQWQQRAAHITGIPWCACFVWCMFDDAGRKVPVKYPASVASWIDWADANHTRVLRPRLADLVAFSWDGQTNHPNDHIGFVEKVLALPWPRNGWRFYLRTVEGNVSDGVYRKWRWTDPKTVAFIRVI